MIKTPFFWSMAIFRCAAFLSLIGFVYLFTLLGTDAKRSGRQHFFYLSYPENPAIGQQQYEGRLRADLKKQDLSGELARFSIELQTEAVRQFAQARKVAFELAAPAGIFEVESARLKFHNTLNSITFELRNPQSLSNGGFVELEGSETRMPDFAGLQVAKLEIEARGAETIALVLQRPEKQDSFPSLVWAAFSDPAKGVTTGAVSGWLEYRNSSFPSFTRAQLLAHMWGWGVSRSYIIYGLAAACGVLWLVGVFLMVCPSCFAGSVARFALPLGCGLLFLSTVGVFSIITPPFHGPDEPDHFLSYAAVSQQSNLPSDALDLAGQGHFERIKRRANEVFTSANLQTPRADAWAYYISPTDPGRSPLANVSWSLLGRILDGFGPGVVLLCLRLAGGLFAALILTTALAAAAWAAPRWSLSFWSSLPALLISPIAYYSAVLSNYPYLIGGYLMQAVGFGVLWAAIDAVEKTGRLEKVGAFLAGAGLGISISSADNAIAAIGFWSVFIPAYLMARDLRQDRVSAIGASIWEFLSVLLSSFLCILAFVALLTQQKIFLPAALKQQFTRMFPVAGHNTVAEWLLVFMFCAGLSGACFVGCVVGRRLRRVEFAPAALRVSLLLLAVGLVTLLAIQPDQSSCRADFFAPNRPSLFAYVQSVAASFAKGFAPGEVDEVVVSYFWQRLGWLDCFLPFWSMETLRLLIGAGVLVLVLTNVFWTGRSAQFFLTIGSAAALAVCLGITAAAYYAVGVDVSSRYLIFCFLFVATVAFEGYRRLSEYWPHETIRPYASAAVVCLLSATFQSTAWGAVIGRYLSAHG
jgi:hypothetical protein